MERKQVKVGLHKGAGLPPGYKWSVYFLTVAESEAKAICGEGAGYSHLVDHVKALASETDPARPQTVDVEKLEDVFELKVKGGPLGKKSVRVFYGIEPERIILIVGCKKKDKEGPLSPGVKKLMAIRRRKYRGGDYGKA